jgi:N-acetylglucosaminyldiphosphoundecaprenol N-acetyl-beta-D-mannosaminyltransferase
MRAERRILGVRIDATSYKDATAQVIEWARAGESRYVCCATVNNVMEARDHSQENDGDYAAVMERADLVTSDGMPLVWALRALGVGDASRVYGPDLMGFVLAAAEREGVPVGFYGGSGEVLGRLRREVRRRYPRIQVAFIEAPPFRAVTDEEDERTVQHAIGSGVRILFVGLGSPKQDRWMHTHHGRIPAVMLGVGAAFDFWAGVKPQAPRWMQQGGLEWFFRLATEPRRLWRRYLKQNPRFAWLAIAQILKSRTSA